MGDGIGLIAIASVVAAVWLQRRLGRARQFDALARSMVSGSLATLGLLASLALLALTDFSGAFLQFHYLAFSNDLWQLDPRTDNLIRMFPEGFFLDAPPPEEAVGLAQPGGHGRLCPYRGYLR